MSDKFKVYARLALHPRGEEDIDGYITRALRLKDLGAIISIVFVMHPSRIEKARMYKDLFEGLGISFNFTPFIGTWNGQEYPTAYTQDQMKLIGEASNWLQRVHCDIKIRNFKGIPCLAGYTDIYMNAQGGIRRCLYDKTILNGSLKKAGPCLVSECGCGLLLEELNSQTPTFWNSWREMAGYPVEVIEKKTDDQLYDTAKAKYFDLMKRYGKL
jgi:hypothetical protein